MGTLAADEFAEINRRRKELRKEMGLPDDDPATASGPDLEAIAAGYDLDRLPMEYDSSLRERIMEAKAKKARGRFWA